MKRICLIVACQLLCLTSWSQLKVQQLLCENLANPRGIARLQPRFSWQLISEKRNLMQSAYEIRVSNSATTLNKGTSWSSGKVSSDQSAYVDYQGKPLESGRVYYWQVRVWDQGGTSTSWSDPSYWQMGLLNPF